MTGDRIGLEIGDRGGKGIGLAIAKKLVELQNATISSTRTVGQGIPLSCTLPIAQKTIIPKKEPAG